MTTAETIRPVYNLRFMCEYPRFGDPDPSYMQRVLRGAQRSGLIAGFMITETMTTTHGLEIIQFTIDMNIHESNGELTREGAMKIARDLLRKKIIRDTDVKVRHVGVVQDQTSMPRFRYGTMRRAVQTENSEEC